MSFGLRTWDEAGNIDIDVTTRLHRFHSKRTVTLQANTGTWARFSVPGLIDDGTWIVLVFKTYIAVNIAPGEVLLRLDQPFGPSSVTATFYVYRC